MPADNGSDVSAALYTGLDSDELERLPERALIHHAMQFTAATDHELRDVLNRPSLASVCDQRLDAVIPLPFRLDDPYACPDCLEVVQRRRAREHSPGLSA